MFWSKIFIFIEANYYYEGTKKTKLRFVHSQKIGNCSELACCLPIKCVDNTTLLTIFSLYALLFYALNRNSKIFLLFYQCSLHQFLFVMNIFYLIWYSIVCMIPLFECTNKNHCWDKVIDAGSLLANCFIFNNLSIQDSSLIIEIL